MITARSPFGVLRARTSRGPLRMLWLTLLMVGLVYAHGVSAESAAHHLSSSASFSALTSGSMSADPVDSSTETAQSPAGAGEEHDEEDPAQPAEECMPGQPQQGAALQVPCSGVLGDSALGGQVPHRSPVADGRTDGLPLAGARATGILRI
ncbi:hypothetical protein NLX86_23110 [Streptomyces sp. A3M-1-3]|uniref:hypothetical protein n=1 Tax=Streptomyces sp. A3M-1-3 TaxID=2962044 RepID=UPI0020B7FA04|nr:hypothetical protein [Streptomyces sp. A3M-1-3]MCP3820877.1 hypothetical protein [Streptomyces sp. A3M-1-3]